MSCYACPWQSGQGLSFSVVSGRGPFGLVPRINHRGVMLAALRELPCSVEFARIVGKQLMADPAIPLDRLKLDTSGAVLATGHLNSLAFAPLPYPGRPRRQ